MIIVGFVLTLNAQNRRKTTTARKTSRTEQTSRRKTAAVSRNTKVTNTNGWRNGRKSGRSNARNHNATVYTNASIRGLQNQRAAIQKKIREQEAALKKNKADVAARLQHLMAINGEIDQRQHNIEGIQKDIHHIEGNIGILNSQLKTLEQQLRDRQQKYIKSMRYMARHRSVQDRLMFIFSAKNFYQMYRRLRFVREYAQYQRAQGEAVRAKQSQVNDKHRQLQHVKGQKNTLLYKGQQEKRKLEGNKAEQQQVVASLQQQQKTIQTVIAEQHKKDAALNAKIDQLVEIEVQKVRARAAAEAKRKAAAAAAAKQRAALLAQKKAAAEAAARENARRIAEARQREAQLKEHGISADRAYIVKVAGMMKERITFPSELWDTCCYFFQAPTEYNEKDVAKRWTPDMHIHMAKVIEILNTVPFEHDAIHKALLDDYIAANGLNTGKVMNSLRIAVVGRTVGPDMITLILMLGKDETIRRVERAIEKLKVEN